MLSNAGRVSGCVRRGSGGMCGLTAAGEDGADLCLLSGHPAWSVSSRREGHPSASFSSQHPVCRPLPGTEQMPGE